MLTAQFPITVVAFYAFAILLIGSALMVIFSKNPVQSALYLVLAFFASTGLWIMLHAEFLGLILILVYVGAVMTLFLFVVMTIPFQTAHFTHHRWQYIIAASLVIFLFLGIMLKVTLPYTDLYRHLESASIPGVGGAEAIGMVLYTDYVFPFELAGLILLVAMIAAVSLSWKTDRKKIVTDPSEQVAVTKKSRLKIVNM